MGTNLMIVIREEEKSVGDVRVAMGGGMCNHESTMSNVSGKGRSFEQAARALCLPMEPNTYSLL